MSPSMRSARLLLLLQLVAFNRQHVSKAFSNQRLASFVLQNQNQIITPFDRQLRALHATAFNAIDASHKNKEILRNASVQEVYRAVGGLLYNIPVVVVKRDKQSRSFRDGSPLVFSGAVAYTVGRDKNGIGQGDLVAIAVAPKGSSSAGEGGGRSRRNNNTRKRRPKYSSSNGFETKHIVVDIDAEPDNITNVKLQDITVIAGFKI